MNVPLRAAGFAAVALLASCQGDVTPPVATAPPYVASASIQEIMEAIVDPAADRVWESVGTTVTTKGVENRQPHTDEEWLEVRNGVITLLEATNLLMMPGRHIVPAGGKLLDEGSEGVLTTAEAQQNFEAHGATFVQFAGALRDVASRLLKAVEEKNAEQVFDIGAEMDAVCEGCHMTFWYPGQSVLKAEKGHSSSPDKQTQTAK